VTVTDVLLLFLESTVLNRSVKAFSVLNIGFVICSADLDGAGYTIIEDDPNVVDVDVDCDSNCDSNCDSDDKFDGDEGISSTELILSLEFI